MQSAKILMTIAAFACLTGCTSNSNSNADQAPPRAAASVELPTTTTTTTTEPAPAENEPAPEKTYVPSPDDPKTHRLNVTIRDAGRAYTPGTCAAIHGQPYGDGFYDPDILVITGPTRHYENVPLKGSDVPIPKSGTPTRDGVCEVIMTVTVPYAPRYEAGIAIFGHGIADPDNPAPSPTAIVTAGDSQDVVVVNYRS